MAVTQPGGALHSISAGRGGKVITANSRAGFEIRDGGTPVQVFEAPEGITLTAAAMLSEGDAVFAGTTSGSDIWIGKVSLASGSITASMQMGGRGEDIPRRLVTDADGFIYLLASTDSSDFPVTQGRWRGGRDGVLVKLTADLGTVFATYLGGASNDDFEDLAVDVSGSIYVTAASNSSEIAAGAQGAALFLSNDGVQFTEGSTGGAFRSTVQTWHTPNANVVLAGTAGQGLFRSTDQGQTWDALNAGLGELNVTSLSGDAQTLYAGTPRALYRSSNGGSSWSELTISASGSGIAALATNPRDRNVVYAGLRAGCGLFRSADGGRTWQTAIANKCVTAIYATESSAYAFAADGVFQQATPQWQRISEFGGITAVAVDASVRYGLLPGKGVYRSDDSGITWAAVYEGPATSIAAQNGRLWIGTADQGIVGSAEPQIPQPVRSIGVSGSSQIFVGTDFLPDIYVAKFSPRGDQILFSTFVGGSGVESSPRIAVDNTASPVIAASTLSKDIAATFEAVQRRNAGESDILLARLNSALNVTAVSYLGGSGKETPAGVAVDSRGFIYVAGTTGSPDFPVSADALRTSNDGTADAFLAVLSPGFGTLAYASYFGRDGLDDRATALSLDTTNIWMSGAQGPDEGFAVRFTGLVRYGAISSVRNAASLQAGPVAPLSTVVIDGKGFGNSISGLSVRMGDSEATVLRASDTQIEVTAPASLQPGATVPVAVTSRNGLFQGTAAVERIAPGMFSANRDGKGVALGALLRIDTESITSLTPLYDCLDGPGTCTAVPVELGDEGDQLFLLLRATGLRNRSNVGDVKVVIGGVEAEVMSTDALDSFTGTDQIVVKLPSGIAEAGRIKEVTIQVTVEGKSANPVTVSIIG